MMEGPCIRNMRFKKFYGVQLYLFLLRCNFENSFCLPHHQYVNVFLTKDCKQQDSYFHVYASFQFLKSYLLSELASCRHALEEELCKLAHRGQIRASVFTQRVLFLRIHKSLKRCCHSKFIDYKIQHCFVMVIQNICPIRAAMNSISSLTIQIVY